MHLYVIAEVTCPESSRVTQISNTLFPRDNKRFSYSDTVVGHQRASIGKHTRKTHYVDTDLLVIKLMPSSEHEAAHLTLAGTVNRELEGIGLPIDSWFPVGAATFHGLNTSKEGDSIYNSMCRPGRDAWPTLVFEAGYSGSLNGLRADAHWQLTNFRGEVKIVIVISIVRAEKSLLIDQCACLCLYLRDQGRLPEYDQMPMPMLIPTPTPPIR
jgi:hypothetical protein